MMAKTFIRAAAFCLALLASPAAAQQAQVSSSVKTFDNNTTAPLQADLNGNLKTVPGGSGATADQVQGNVASGAADSGNPVKIGAVYTSGALGVLTSGFRANTGADPYGNTRVAITAQNPSANLNGVLTGTSVGYPQDNSTGTSQPMLLGGTSLVYTGSGNTFVYASGDANGTVVQSGLSSTFWSYSNGATGILSNTTTAVTIKAAAGASVRNYIDSCQINTTAFAVSVPLAIRDGAGGTIVWALSVPSAGFLNPVSIVFNVPIKGTANTLLEVVTTTANTTGTVWVNCQGHTGS